MMHNPPHPGIFLNETVIKPLALSVTEAAKNLGMSRSALSRVLNGKAGISPDRACLQGINSVVVIFAKGITILKNHA